MFISSVSCSSVISCFSVGNSVVDRVGFAVGYTAVNSVLDIGDFIDISVRDKVSVPGSVGVSEEYVGIAIVGSAARVSDRVAAGNSVGDGVFEGSNEFSTVGSAVGFAVDIAGSTVVGIDEESVIGSAVGDIVCLTVPPVVILVFSVTVCLDIFLTVGGNENFGLLLAFGKRFAVGDGEDVG